MGLFCIKKGGFSVYLQPQTNCNSTSSSNMFAALLIHLNSSDIRNIYYSVALGSNSLHLTLFVFLDLEDKLIPAVMSRYFCSFS